MAIFEVQTSTLPNQLWWNQQIKKPRKNRYQSHPGNAKLIFHIYVNSNCIPTKSLCTTQIQCNFPRTICKQNNIHIDQCTLVYWRVCEMENLQKFCSACTMGRKFVIHCWFCVKKPCSYASENCIIIRKLIKTNSV